MTIIVKYSCPSCALHQVACAVPAREDEDVLTWMEQTIYTIGLDHHRRSPKCHPDTLLDLMIPMTRTNHLGGPTLQ